MHRFAWLCLPLLAFAACDDGPTTVGDILDDPELPPRGSDDLLGWLEAGHYKGWACEAEAHPPRSPSAHARNRICSNALLSQAPADSAFPVGAAAVKEIFDSEGTLAQFAVSRRVDTGPDGDSWYWFEGRRGDVPFNGEGETTCTGCHSRASRDFVFTIVTQ